MAVDKISMNFSNQFEGTLISPTGQVEIGEKADTMKPYHLLFGALGSCFYSTFVSVANKKRLEFKSASLEIEGTKREELPKTLDFVKMTLTIKGADQTKKEQFMRSVDYGVQYCSIHATISKVAKIDVLVNFED